jgi:hypothetical protein
MVGNVLDLENGMKKEKEREKDWGDLSSNKALTGLKLTSSAQSRFD